MIPLNGNTARVVSHFAQAHNAFDIDDLEQKAERGIHNRTPCKRKQQGEEPDMRF